MQKVGGMYFRPLVFFKLIIDRFDQIERNNFGT
jgi:hypothetical protein